MSRRPPRSVLVPALAVLLVVLACGLAASRPRLDDPARHPAARAAEATFFEAFNHTGKSEAPLRPLLQAWSADSGDARVNLLLGLNHLWLAAEGDRTDARVIEQLLLSETYLSRAAALAPDDDRIPSWLSPVRMALAEIEGDAAAFAAERDRLLAAYAGDPAFHSFSVGIMGFPKERGSELFRTGLDALRAVAQTGCEPDDPSCKNLPPWPHNIEGYLTFMADYELKAGHGDRADLLLAQVRALPTFGDWPFADEVTDRLENRDLYLALYADDDPGNDPPSIIGSHGCSSCHFGGEK